MAIAPATVTAADVVRLCRALGYPLPFAGQVLPFGVRSAETQAGEFDDAIGLLRCTKAPSSTSAEYDVDVYPGTTDPGAHYLAHPLNPLGTAILVPGFHESVWTVGRHKGRYRALVQTAGPVRVWRDDDRDTVLDVDAPLPIDAGHFGINLHPAGLHSPQSVGRWSAGCQVLRHVRDCDRVVTACERALRSDAQAVFSYALFTSAQLEAARRAGPVPTYPDEQLQPAS